MPRSSRSETVIVVEVVAKPLTTGKRHRENGPHLGDLRRFVADAEGLPDDALVRIDKGYMGERGRYDVSISTRHTEVLGDLVEPEAPFAEVSA